MKKRATQAVGQSDYEKLYRLELEELNTPYTDEEIALHLHHREWKSIMEMIHAHNWQLIMLCREWHDYLVGKAKRPVRKICKYVNPSQSADINNACFFIKRLIELMSGYGEGNCPQARINTYASRSTATLIEKLDALKHSTHLIRAECASNKIFKFATYGGEPTMPPEEYAKMLHELADTFVSECTANAEELSHFTANAVAQIEGEGMASIFRLNNKPITKDEAMQMLKSESAELKTVITNDGDATRKVVRKAQDELSEIGSTVSQINARDKRYRRKSKAKHTLEELEQINALWENAQKNPHVKRSSIRRPSLNAAIDYFRKEFRPLKINTAADLRKALKARSRRIANHQSKGK